MIVVQCSAQLSVQLQETVGKGDEDTLVAEGQD